MRKTIRSTAVGMVLLTSVLVLILTPAAPRAQGQGGPPAQSGQQGGLSALQTRVQALEQQVPNLSAALSALGTAVGAEDAALQAQIDAAGAQLAAFQQLLDQFGPRLSTAEGNITGLQAQTTALEKKSSELSAALDALTMRVGTLDDALQAQIADVSTQITGFQQLLDQYNQGLSTAEGKITTLEGKVADLEAQLAGLGDGLTSYDALAGRPCTTAVSGAGTVNLVGLLKSPVCAAAISANGRFFDLGPVVLDTQTNLMWEKKTTTVGSGHNFADLHDVDNRYDWFIATGGWIAGVNAEVFAGFSNWRVPTRDELLTIVDMNMGPPRIDPIFGPTEASYYWSSNEVGSSNAWFVTFFTGFANFDLGFKLFDFRARAVRAGP